LTVEQPHSDDRDPEITGRLELIARHVAEAAGVDRQPLGQHELHAEVGDARERRVGVAQLEPGRSLLRLASGLQQALNAAAEGGIRHEPLDPVAGGTLQHDPWAVSQRPPVSVELLPQGIRGMVPGPTHIERQLCQVLEPLDIRGQQVVDRARPPASLTR